MAWHAKVALEGSEHQAYNDLPRQYRSSGVRFHANTVALFTSNAIEHHMCSIAIHMHVFEPVIGHLVI